MNSPKVFITNANNQVVLSFTVLLLKNLADFHFPSLPNVFFVTFASNHTYIRMYYAIEKPNRTCQKTI